MRIPRLTIEMLEGVVALARHKTFDRAGQALGISGSALHKRIGKLNAIFGTEVFLDTGHGMKLRDEAQALNELGLRIIEYALLAEHRTMAWISRDAQAIQIGHSTHMPPKLLALPRASQLLKLLKCTSDRLLLCINHEPIFSPSQPPSLEGTGARLPALPGYLRTL